MSIIKKTARKMFSQSIKGMDEKGFSLINLLLILGLLGIFAVVIIVGMSSFSIKDKSQVTPTPIHNIATMASS